MSATPRRTIPLACGDGSDRPCMSVPSRTKRVFLCGVVVEGSEQGKRLPQDVEKLVKSLGTRLSSRLEDGFLPSSLEPSAIDGAEADQPHQRKRAMTDTSALVDVINELVNTERSYVKRLRILKHDYADPLRQFARNKSTAILPSYEAKILFGNIDSLLPVNEAFLTDLEKMIAPNGSKHIGGVGDVTLKHFKQLRGFEHYKHYYAKREEAQAIFERETKKSSSFSAYIDRIKYSSADVRNRVGLRELLMDPVQRIPRYTMMFRTMVKHMALVDPQRAKLIEADDIASKIALAETDEETKRAATMYCLSATVDGFPPGLISNSRRFIDCIDVEDVDVPAPSGQSSSSASAGQLHCTLFLFDDKLVIAKRPGNGEKAGRTLAGLDEMEKVTKAGGLPHGMKKSGMSCKGVVDITDITATDVGGADIHVYLENPPQDQSERWNGRSFRSLAVVQPPAPVNLDPVRTEAEKKRFLENLWIVQARFRAKAGQSVVLQDEERELEAKGGRITLARTYYNVYQRTAFLKESRKTKIVVHVDALGTADPIPFGVAGPPYVVVRVQPMAGELSRYTVTSRDVNDEGEEDIVQTSRVPARIVETIHQYGLFKFRTGKSSMPSTPTMTTRSRAAIFGLEAISRNLLNARLGTSKVDFFGGSVNSHRRSKSAGSRSSVYTQSTSTGDGSLAVFSHQSDATTSVTTVSDDEFFASRSTISTKSMKPKKLSKRKAPESDTEVSPRLNRALYQTRSSTDVEYSDCDEDDETTVENRYADQSEWDLAKRLELARKNSQNQRGKPVPPLPIEARKEDTIYEEKPPSPIRTPSRPSREGNRSLTPRAHSPSHHARSRSDQISDRPTAGSRRPSPAPRESPKLPELPLEDNDPSADTNPSTSSQNLVTPPRRETETSIPRSKRLPFIPTGNAETTPKATIPNALAPPQPCSVEPLSIKKKTSVRSSVTTTPSPGRKGHARHSSLVRSSTRRVSPQSKQARGRNLLSDLSSTVNIDRAIHLAQTTKEDVESSHRAVKRIKIELEEFRSESSTDHESPKQVTPSKGSTRSPPLSTAAMTRAAQERMEEMRQLIQQRQGEHTPQMRPRGWSTTSIPRSPMDSRLDTLDSAVSDAEKELTRALSSYESLQQDLRQVAVAYKERTMELEKTKIELRNAKRQCELVKSLLADATKEKEILFEAFNEELDGMYNDANLPEDEAWAAISKDLRQTKESRNALTKENSQLKRNLAESEMQKEEWGALLRTHGLIT